MMIDCQCKHPSFDKPRCMQLYRAGLWPIICHSCKCLVLNAVRFMERQI